MAVEKPVSLLFGAEDVDVVGDEEFPDTRRRGSPARDELARTKIWLPFIFSQL